MSKIINHLWNNTILYPILLWTLQLLVSIGTAFFCANYINHGPYLQTQLLSEWFKGFGAWDWGWYYSIAKDGYTSLQPTAFFPGYPLLVRVLHNISGFSYLTCAFLLSNLSYAAALVFLYKVVLNIANEAAARKTLLILSVFPSAMFFNVPYTESLTLLTTVIFFYFLQKNMWYAAMLSGFFATGIHDLGIILAFPALIYLWNNRHNYSWKILVIRLTSIGIICSSLLGYMIYLYIGFGDLFAFTKAQTNWNRIINIPIINIFKTLAAVILKWQAWDKKFVMTINSFCALLFIALAVYGTYLFIYKKRKVIPFDMLVFFIVTLILSIITGTLNKPQSFFDLITGGSAESYARYMSVIFPGFIIAAGVLNKRYLYISAVIISFMLKIVMLSLFVNGYLAT